jgi:FolB domain-containing protein
VISEAQRDFEGREEPDDQEAQTPVSTDRIEIKDLLLRTIIGVNDWERRERQDVVVNLTLHVDLRGPGEHDTLDGSVNYRSVAKRVIECVESSRRETLEALAADIARVCLSEPGVERASVSVEKPHALRFARSVGVTIERGKGDVG